MKFEGQIKEAKSLEDLVNAIKPTGPKRGQVGGRQFEVKKSSLEEFEKKFASLAKKELQKPLSVQTAQSLGKCIGFIEQRKGKPVEQRLSKLGKMRKLISGKQMPTIQDTLQQNIKQISDEKTRREVSLSMLVHSMEWANESRANDVNDTLERYIENSNENNKTQLLQTIIAASPIGKVVPNITELGDKLTTEAKKENITFDFKTQWFTHEDLISLDKEKITREEKIFDTIQNAVDETMKSLFKEHPKFIQQAQTWKPSNKERQDNLAKELAALATADRNTIEEGVKKAVENFKEGIASKGFEDSIANDSLMRLAGSLFQKEDVLLGREKDICLEIMKLV